MNLWIFSRGIGTREKTCGSKVRHATLEAADKHKYGLIASGNAHGYLRAYLCPYCSFYHIGKAYRKRKTQIRFRKLYIHATWGKFDVFFHKRGYRRIGYRRIQEGRVVCHGFWKFELRYRIPVMEAANGR